MIKASITNQNREYVTDKNALMASLNNTNGSSHHYQNVQFQKPPQPSSAQQQQQIPPANSTESTVKKNIALLTSSLEANGHTIGANNVNKVNLTQSAVNGISINTSSPPANLLKTRTVEGYVGFANLPNQVYRKAVKKGFEFNLMVIGESGLGKSTFINSLFLTELYNSSEFPGTFERKKKTTYVDSTNVVLSEKGVNLKLAIVDTPGFGDSIDNSNCWQPVVEYIEGKYEEYLNAESKVNRKLPIADQRIHCCLYFIAPGHTLKQLDIEVMKKLHDKVNLIPVIAKADTMTLDELKQFKSTVLNVINEHKIQIYEFPDLDDDDIDTNRTNNLLKVFIFSLV